MASLNPSSDITAFIGTIFDGAVLVARDQNLMGGLVRVFNDRTGIAVRQNSQYGGATMNDIGETDDLVGQAFTPSSIATLSPTEAGAQYFLTDTRVESDPFAVRVDASTDLGQAMATKIETDLCGEFDALTSGTIGNAGSLCTWSYILAMESILRNAKAPYPYALVMSPYHWYPLGKAASVATTATNAPQSLLEQVNQSFFVRQAGGVSIFVTSNVPASTANGKYAGMFSRDAIALDIRRQPRLEPERDASRRGFELNMSAVYAHGVWRPTFGVCGNFIASTPDGT